MPLTMFGALCASLSMTIPRSPGRAMVGWFDKDRAELFRSESLGPNTFEKDPAARQSLYRTSQGAAGSCVRNVTVARTVTIASLPTQARRWLNHQGLGMLPPGSFSRRPNKRTPPRVGRPEVGGPVTVRLGDELLTEVDDYAGARNVSRADAIRDLLKAALAEVQSPDELVCATG